MDALISGFNWYGFLIGSGMLICIALAYFMSKGRGFNGDVIFDIALIGIPLAIVGARAYYIIFDVLKNDNLSEWTFKRIIGLEGGLSGLAIYGGLIGGVVGIMLVYLAYKKKPQKERVSFFQILDIVFSVVVLGQVIGRWGNFANQEAYGNLVTNSSLQWFPYAVKIDGLWYQATFFYESFCNAILFTALMFFYNGKRKSFDGFCFSIYCIGYGVARFFIEGLRSDSLYLGSFRISQLVSALIILLGLFIIFSHVYNAKKQGKKPFILVKRDNLSLDYYGYEKSRFFILDGGIEENNENVSANAYESDTQEESQNEIDAETSNMDEEETPSIEEKEVIKENNEVE